MSKKKASKKNVETNNEETSVENTEYGELICLGGLWYNETEKTWYASGSLGQAKIMIFPNSYKNKENEPDWKMYITAKPKNTEGIEPPKPPKTPIKCGEEDES